MYKAVRHRGRRLAARWLNVRHCAAPVLSCDSAILPWRASTSWHHIICCLARRDLRSRRGGFVTWGRRLMFVFLFAKEPLAAC